MFSVSQRLAAVAIGLASTAAIASGINVSVVPVSAIVQPSAQVKFEVVPISISISTADIERGYIDIPVGSLLSIKSGQALPPVIIDFSMGDGVFKSVEVRERENAKSEDLARARRTDLRGSEDEKDAAIGKDPRPSENASAYDRSATAFAYRFRLSEKAKPGSYQVPLILNVTF